MDALNQFQALFQKDRQARVFFNQDAKFALVNPGDDKPITLTGYALLWNVLSTDRGGYKVRLLPNSAKVTSNALALYTHDLKLVIGAAENGTFRYASDDVGLKVEIDLPDTSTGNDVAELVGEKYVKGMSFGMLLDPPPVMVAKTEGDQNVLEISEFAMDEASVLARPAFTQTSIDIKPDVSISDQPDFAKVNARREKVRKERVAADRLQAELLKP